MATVYLADVGFRPAGVRLAAPVRVADGKHTLTLGELIATPEGTDLTYHLTGLIGDEGYTPRQDVVAIARAGEERVLTRGAFSFGSDRASLRRRISSTSAIPHWTGPVDVAIAISGVGEFRLAAQLKPFGAETDAPRRDVNKSAKHQGITVTVRGVGAAREETAVEVEVEVGEDECCVGIGALRGRRLGPTALSLTDESGRVYMERWQEPGNMDHATLALFQPLHPEARDVELTVPYVFVEEPKTTTEAFALPVTSPVEMRLGRYGLATGQIRLPIEEQQLLLCAHEECQLWEVLGTVSEVITSPTKREQVELVRQLLLKYLDKGWIAIAQARDESGKWDPTPISDRLARELVSIDDNWGPPDDHTRTPGEPFVVVLTPVGEKALEAGAAAQAFARIGEPPTA